MKSKIRLIATDLDGTLFCAYRQIGARTVKALLAAREAGIQTVMASGRDARTIQALEAQFGLDGAYSISHNGARVSAPGGAALYERFVPLETAQQVFDRLRPLGVYALGYSGQACYQLSDQDNAYGHDAALQYPIQSAEALKEPVYKIVAVSGQPQRLAQVREALGDLPGIELNSSWPDNVEIMPLNANKGTALTALMAHLRLSRDQVMAFGDESNDLEMLLTCGYPVAMENATEQVKRIACHVAPSSQDEGVAQVVERLLRGELTL